MQARREIYAPAESEVPGEESEVCTLSARPDATRQRARASACSFSDFPVCGSHGFRDLQSSQWTPGMRAIRDQEAEHGRHVDARVFMRHDLGITSTPEPPPPHWPEHLPVGALRVTRWSSRYDETVRFYQDIIGLPLLETFRASYGLDGTILGLPGSRTHLEIVGLRDGPPPTPGRDDLVFYLPDAAARDHIVARLASAGVHPVAQIDYWEDNGGVTFEDPDGRKIVFVSWIYGQ